MGCSNSKLNNKEAVQLCKDRKKFIKQAVEQRIRFASGHIAYIQSLKRVSVALRNYIEGDEPGDFFLDSYATPAFTPLKKMRPSNISISSKSFSTPVQSETNSSFKVNYLRSGGNPSVSVEERLPLAETVRIESYSPMQNFGSDGFYATQPSPVNSSLFTSSPYNKPSFPPPSPQTSQWDFFWNPFCSLDIYGCYPTLSCFDPAVMDDEITGPRQVRNSEGKKEVGGQDEKENMTKVRSKTEANFANCTKTDSGTNTEHKVKGLQSHGTESIKVSEAGNAVKLEVRNQEMARGDQEDKEETPGFAVYVNRKLEIIKDLETQFTIVCNSANEVSTMLKASKAQHSSTSTGHKAVKMLNPVGLFCSAPSRSSSSSFLHYSSTFKYERFDTSSDFSDDSCMFAGSHQATLDKLYAWEKKLYKEVKSGEQVRIAYEKKCMQLRNQDAKEEDPSVEDKTKAAIRDLHTQINISMHTIEAISKRIETLRDEELQPQIFELIQGLARMWEVMAECHQSQKLTMDEAKVLLASVSTAKPAAQPKHTEMSSPTEAHPFARSAAKLQAELRNWQSCFKTWIASQQSYVHALTGWLLRCVLTDKDTETSDLPSSPPPPPVFGACVQWCRFLDDTPEIPVMDGLDFFADGVGSVLLYTQQQLREDSRQTPIMVSKGFSPEVMEEEVVTVEKMAEVAMRVLCGGMSVAMSSLTEFAVSSAQGYADLVKQWENATSMDGPSKTEI